MDANLIVYLVIGGVFAIGVGALALYRRYLSRQEVDVLHISDAESDLIPKQEMLAQRIATIDLWGKVLTAGLVVYCLVVVSMFLYQNWQATSKIVNQ